jgi:hypothetical protein
MIVTFIKDSLVSYTLVLTGSDCLFSPVWNVSSKFHLESKLVIQMFNGTSLMSGQLNGLRHEVLEAHPYAFHVKCSAHALNPCSLPEPYRY